MSSMTQAEDLVKAAIFTNQIEATKLVGQILSTEGETLCGNDLEKLAQYLTLIGAVKTALETEFHADEE